MATSKLLQTPQILGITATSIKVAHPDLSSYAKTFLRANIAAAGTALTVGDNNGFADDDWFIIGDVGDSTTEEDDVNGAVTRGTALTVTNTLKFGHNLNDPATRIQERGVKIYGAATDGGSGTLIASIDALAASGTQLADAVNIKWNAPFTLIQLISTDTTYAYYYAKYTDGTTDSSASDYVLAAGLGSSSVAKMTEAGLRTANQEVDGLITEPFLIGAANDCQDEITQYSFPDTNGNIIRKDWAFELVENDSSIDALTMENRYALSDLTYALKYPDTKQAIINLRFGDRLLRYIPPQEMDLAYEGIKRAELSAATSVGATSLTLDNSTEFAETGTVKIGGDSITYTANAQSTGVLSGIPASGTGSITEIFAVGRAAWQGISGGRPSRYTIWDGEIILDVPVLSTYVGYRLKARYFRALTALTKMTSTTSVPFTLAFKWYIAAQIAYRKGQFDKAEKYMAEFGKIVLMNAKGDISMVAEPMTYMNFGTGDNLNDLVDDVRFLTN